jgi:hypothetical protein
MKKITEIKGPKSQKNKLIFSLKRKKPDEMNFKKFHKIK